MATPKKSPTKRPSSSKKSLQKSSSFFERVRTWGNARYDAIVSRQQAFLARRPHRSFKLSRRRDYVRSLTIPGYISFTIEVNRALRRYWKLFLPMVLLYAAIVIALGAVTSQDVYTTLSGLVAGAGEDFFTGGAGQLLQAGVLTITTFASGSSTLTPEQSVYLGFSLLFAWLATVWLLRELLAGRRPRLRDGLYNSGAPILSSVGVVLVGLLQLIPIGIVMLVYAGLSAIGVVNEGFGAMLFWVFAAVVAALVLYWLTSTIIALVVVTIPGMYPLRAVQLSGDLVVGRRLRILLRLLWGLVLTGIAWSLVVFASVLIDNLVHAALPDIADYSVVPYIVALATSFSIIWYAAYVYLFYRKVVDDDAKPA